MKASILPLGLAALVMFGPAEAWADSRPAPGPQELLRGAETHIENGRMAEARRELLASAALLASEHPLQVRIHARTGTVLLAQGYTATAKDSFAKALALARSLRILNSAAVADAHLGMGLCLIKEDNWPEALGFFRRALKAGPSPRTRQVAETYLDLSKNRGPAPE